MRLQTRVRLVWVRMACAVAATTSLNVTAAAPADLDSYVQQAMHAFDVPGLGLALVERGEPPIARGYGVRKMGQAARVDAHTVFSIASNTKAFTTTALAILVDQGKLSWDDKVSDRLPGFRLYDAYTTSQMTIRDLLTHRSGLGLGAGDLLFWPETTFSRADVLARLRYIRPATSFRSGYAYDNVLYIVAGALVEAASGQTWDDFVRTHLLGPLGMHDAVPSFKDVKTDNRGWPHARISGRVRGMGPVEPIARIASIDNEAPAGGIHASASDMTHWIEVQLDRGRLGAGRLFSEATGREMWTSQTLIPIEPTPAPLALTTPQFNTYGLGWVIRDYRGHKIIMHEGLQEGEVSATVLIPEQHVGFIVMLNSEDGEARWSVCYHLLDHYLGFPATDWIGAYTLARQQSWNDALQTLQTASEQSFSGPTVKPTLPLADYAGLYEDPWYGTVTISWQAKQLRISFDHTPAMHGKLEHVTGDTFRTRFNSRTLEDAYVTFSVKADHSVEQVRMRAISPLADFSFDFGDLVLTPVKYNRAH